MTTVPRFKTILASYPHTLPLKGGLVSSDKVTLAFEEVEPIHKAFKPMAMNQHADVCEMAIVTYLQAKSYNKPVFMLPFVVASRFQQGCIIHNTAVKPLDVSGLRNARVGVRSYSQTTGVWVRAILQNTYGIAPDQIEWITFDPAHLAEYDDPSWCTRAPSHKALVPMLRAGEIDAAILGNDLPKEANLEPVIADHVAADNVWFQQNHFVPINHVVVMRRVSAQAHPATVSAVYEMLLEGKAKAKRTMLDIDYIPSGIDKLYDPLKLLIKFCNQQKLLARNLSVDEVFEDFLSFK
ncbi:MAG: hypothetical protein B7Z75_02345 [Acidocella sp. 20-57-95]|nr:MAG: hypothetical protein B7Z75_02345 [Acidocella sp. 20-57-95]HQT63844.1 hypothetical protein [Acidocella sp.]